MTDRRILTPQFGAAGPFIDRVLLDVGTPWCRPLPAFVADLADSRTQHSVFDQPREKHAKFRTQYGPSILFGSHHFHAILDKEGRLSLQETDQNQVASRLRDHLQKAPDTATSIPWISKEDGVYFYRIDANLRVVALDGPIFFASPIEPANFGMWILNGIPSASEFAARGRTEKYLCWAQFDWQYEILRFMGIDMNQVVVQKPWHVYGCETVTLHQYSKVDLIPTNSDKEVFSEILERCGRSHAASPSRIFLSRRSVTAQQGRRRLLEENELAAALESRGFAIIEPEMMPFPEQVRLFRGARVVVGLGGAALFSTVFCTPGTKVISIEGMGNFAENHASLFAGLGLEYGFIFGQQDESDPMPVHKRWSLNVRRAVQHIVAFTGT